MRKSGDLKWEGVKILKRGRFLKGEGANRG